MTVYILCFAVLLIGIYGVLVKRDLIKIILALGIIAMLGPSMSNLIITIGVVYTPTFVRLVNGSVLSVKRNEYVVAARALGSRDVRILALHILPNIVAPILVQASLTFSTAILVPNQASIEYRTNQ